MSNHNTPILVTGTHRSGTTWVGRMLCLDAQMHYVHEPFNVFYPNDEVGVKLSTWYLQAEHAEPSVQAELQQAFSRLIDATPVQRAQQACAFAGYDWKTPARFAKHWWREQTAPTRMLFKDPIALLSADWLHQQFDAQVVCMIRNPLAFVASLKQAGWGFVFSDLLKQEELMCGSLADYRPAVERAAKQPGDIVAEQPEHFLEQACLVWNMLHAVIKYYQQQYTDNPNWCFIRHEDLSMQPIEQFKSLYRQLNLAWTDQVANAIHASSSSQNKADAGTTKFTARDAAAALDNWKKRLTSEEQQYVVANTASLREYFYPDIEFSL